MPQAKLTLIAQGAVTTTTNGSAVSTLAGTTRPVTNTTVGSQKLRVYLDVPTVTSTQATLDLTIQGRPTPGSGTWFTLQPLQGGATANWTQVTTATSAQTREFAGPIPPEIRAVLTTAATSPSYVVGVYATAEYESQ